MKILFLLSFLFFLSNLVGHKRDVIKLKSFTEGLTRRPKSIRNVTMRPVMENNAATMPSHERLSDQNESKGEASSHRLLGGSLPRLAPSRPLLCVRACRGSPTAACACVRRRNTHTRARAPAPPPHLLHGRSPATRQFGEKGDDGRREREWGMGKRMTICALASRSSWMGGWMERRATDFDVIGDTSPDSRKTHVMSKVM